MESIIDEKTNVQKKPASQISVFQICKESVKISKKVSISSDLILMMAKYKTDINMQSFQIVTDCLPIKTIF